MNAESGPLGPSPAEEIGELKRVQEELAGKLRRASEIVEAERARTDTLRSQHQQTVARLEQAIADRDDILLRRNEQIEQLAQEMLAEREHAVIEAHKQVAVAEANMRDHLAYRFGKALLAIGRNPLRIFLLPFEFVRQYRAYAQAGREPARPDPPQLPHPFELVRYEPRSETDEEAAAVPDPATANSLQEKPREEPPIVDIGLAHSLTLKALAELSPPNLTELKGNALKDGDLTMQKRLAEMEWMRDRSRKNDIQLRLILGKLRELDTRWLPSVGGKSSFEPLPNKILHIFKVFYPQESTGGAVRNWSVWRNQAQAGLKPVAALPPGPVDEALIPEARGKTGLIRVSEGDGTIYYCNMDMPDRRALSRDATLSFETSLLDHIARTERPSLIHAASGFRGYETALKGLALARAHDLPFVYEVRSFHEHVWGPLRSDLMELEETRLRTAQEHRCMAEADAIVTISQTMARELAERGIDEQKITVVPNCLDAEFFENIDPDDVARFRNEWNLEGSTVIGYISNLSDREGHSVLVDAFAQIADTRPDAKLLLVGDGPNYARLQEDIARRGIEDRAVMTGIIDHKQIGVAYAAIDLFVVPRIEDYASDFVTPMKPFEAMAVGCPLIMSDRPVSWEIIGEDRGLMFKTKDARDLAETMIRCLDNKEETQERTRRAREWVREHRRWSDVIRRYEGAYEQARAAHAEKRAGGNHGRH